MHKNISTWIGVSIMLLIIATVGLTVYVGSREAATDSGAAVVSLAPAEDVAQASPENAGSLQKKEAGRPDTKTAQAPMEMASIYTDLTVKACKTLRESAEHEGFVEQECPGVGGYALRIVEQDARQELSVVSPDGKVSGLDLNTLIGASFSTVGDKAEWRVSKGPADASPQALIVRFTVGGDVRDRTSYLAAVKIGSEGVCVVGKIYPSDDANTKARETADDAANRPCLSSENPDWASKL